MIIKGVDLGLSEYLIGEVNPFKKDIKILKNEPKNIKVFYSFPSVKSTFRKYRFPFKDRSKIEKAIKTQLSLDLPFPIDSVKYSYYLKTDKNGADVFCVIAKKEDIDAVKDADIIDSELFSFLRICMLMGKDNCGIIHFSDGYVVQLLIKNSFIEYARVIPDVDKIPEGFLLSGKIPEKFSSYEKLKIDGIDTKLNVCYGLLLRGIFNVGIDFSGRSGKDYIEKLLKGAFYILLSGAVLNGALFYKSYTLEKQLKKIKEKENEIFIKTFNYTGEIFDPLEQAKSKLLLVEKESSISEDAVELLDYIGNSMKSTAVHKIYSISITDGKFRIKGVARSISDVEQFKDKLSEKFRAKIEETVNTPEGEIRFIVSGEGP
ncbi:hypothetical protein [Persephonella sp.]